MPQEIRKLGSQRPHRLATLSIPCRLVAEDKGGVMAFRTAGLLIGALAVTMAAQPVRAQDGPKTYAEDRVTVDRPFDGATPNPVPRSGRLLTKQK